LASADEVRRFAPKAWPKWTYGPHGERCWYSGRKPIFQKEMPVQAAAIPAPFSDAPIDTPSQAGSNKTQSPPCLASAAEVRRSAVEILGLPTRLADREYAPTPGDASG